MNKWFKQHFNMAIIITLLTGYGAGAAGAAVLNSDVENLKNKVDGIPERLGRVEQKIDDLKELILLQKAMK
tara:strand:- start:500 stop:712 length:213 start_codon:yes stop_codon:yes gene_type:complete